MARVSTKDQEDGHSLDAQSMRLKEYCNRKGFVIDKEYTLTESSTRGDRPEFHKMLKYIHTCKANPVALIVDTVDRLQ